MEIFINEKSLHEQYASIHELQEAIKIINSIFSFLEENMKNGTLYKDILLFNQQAIKNEYFQASFGKVSPQLQLSFKMFLSEKLKAVDWRNAQIHDKENFYQCELLENSLISDTSLAEIAERNLQNPENNYVLLNFIKSKFENLENISILKGLNEEQDVIEISCADTKENLKKWLENIASHVKLDAILHDANKFQKTNFLFRKSGRSTPIYRELSTGYYWYADFYHKDNKFHFEVFDANGTHLHEATQDGIVVPDSQDTKKRITV